jgi:uracil phosphoribosyltransferase
MSSEPTPAEHRYGPQVTILDNPLIATAIARLGRDDVTRGEVWDQLRLVYTALTLELARGLPRTEVAWPTRMAAAHPREGVYRGQVLDPGSQAVICDVIRGGMVPGQLCFELLTQCLPDEQVRQDHLNLARVADAQGRVTGVNLFGSKIGGPVDGATLIVPDPMGATGSTLARVWEHYLEHHGRPARMIALTMICTPEFLRRVTELDPCVSVITARLDRGLSPPDVLACVPGERWSEERGLDDQSYIVPGAGGVGEVLNNAWV